MRGDALSMEPRVAEVSNGDGTSRVDEVRKTDIFWIDPNSYPDIDRGMMDAIGDPDVYVGEYQYLRYHAGGHYHRHHDILKHVTDLVRVYTCVTMMYKSPDLEGGFLDIWVEHELDEYGRPRQMRVDLAVGDTVIFPSHYYHAATEVFNGTREVLVNWMYRKDW